MIKEKDIKRILGIALFVGGSTMAIRGGVDLVNLNKEVDSQLGEKFPNVRNVCVNFDRISDCRLEVAGETFGKKPQETLDDYKTLSIQLRQRNAPRATLNFMSILQLPLLGALGIKFLKGGDRK